MSEAVEPVAWMGVDGEPHLYWEDESDTPLYPAPPTTKTAVAASLRKAAEVCLSEEKAADERREHAMAVAYRAASIAILALPRDDSALRELIDVAVESSLQKAAEAVKKHTGIQDGFLQAAILTLPHEEIINDVLEGK